MSPELSERITITVPRELFDRLQKVKDNINVSGVCREGLEMAVRKEETKKMEGGEMEKLIERLKAEKAESEKIKHDEGFKAGRKNAMGFSYEDFKAFELIQNKIDGYGQHYDAEEHLVGIIEDCLDDPEKVFGDDWEELQEKSHAVFLVGFIEGVLDLWGEVADKI